MEIKTTYTVDGETFDTEQEALDHSYYLERKAGVKKLIVEVFPDDSHAHLCGGYVPEYIANQIVKNPEIFKQALDIVEGK
tara:strand:- start:174 stop:413 length:240 start_codon:yes stop_codon:yes gene_type:complete